MITITIPVHYILDTDYRALLDDGKFMCLDVVKQGLQKLKPVKHDGNMGLTSEK
jgi:hypothetical protein